MKKSLLFLALFVSVTSALHAQALSINGFGGYNFQDQVNFGNVYGHVQDGAFWGVSIEGINRTGSALELLYQNQSTKVPLYLYNTGVQANKGNEQVTLNYILLNGIHYMTENPHVMPYGGLGAGVGFSSGQSGSSYSKFAWDLKLGVKFKPGNVVGIKIQAQLFSVVQAAGTAFYVGPGGGAYGVSTYSSIYQFGFTGGLTFDFEGKRKH